MGGTSWASGTERGVWIQCRGGFYGVWPGVTRASSLWLPEGPAPRVAGERGWVVSSLVVRVWLCSRGWRRPWELESGVLALRVFRKRYLEAFLERALLECRSRSGGSCVCREERGADPLFAGLAPGPGGLEAGGTAAGPELLRAGGALLASPWPPAHSLSSQSQPGAHALLHRLSGLCRSNSSACSRGSSGAARPDGLSTALCTPRPRQARCSHLHPAGHRDPRGWCCAELLRASGAPRCARTQAGSSQLMAGAACISASPMCRGRRTWKRWLLFSLS